MTTGQFRRLSGRETRKEDGVLCALPPCPYKDGLGGHLGQSFSLTFLSTLDVSEDASRCIPRPLRGCGRRPTGFGLP